MVTKPFRTRDMLRKDSKQIHATALRRDGEIRATSLKKFQETHTLSLKGSREEHALAQAARDPDKLNAH